MSAAEPFRVRRGRMHADGSAIARRSHVEVALAAAVGAATGAVVAAFEELVRGQAYRAVLDLPSVPRAIMPAVGLVATAVILVRFAGRRGATTDAYIAAYHERGGELRVRHAVARLVACAATLGSGGALGYEGPAIFIGGTIGSLAERRLFRRFAPDDAKVLMVAGAAAGVAAVFKAPLTGIVFAMEVPYRQDLARRSLLPALVAAATSYLVFVSLLGTEPVLRTGGTAPFDRRDLLGGLAIGLICGALARIGAWAVQQAKQLRVALTIRVGVAGATLFGLALVTEHYYGAPLTLGSGYDAIEWAQSHETAVGLLATLFVLRFAATWLMVAAGGVGGLFIPLVTQGALLGQLVQALVHGRNPMLFTTVGIAAFLGGGYRTPLAGVAFVAEATGQPGFVVPALLAAAASQLVMGRWSFSPYQRAERRPEPIMLGRMQVRELMTPNPDTIDEDTSLDRCADVMMSARRRWAPVTAHGRYAGIVALEDIAAVRADERAGRTVASLVHRDNPISAPETSVVEVASIIRGLGVGAVAIVENDTVIGVVTERDLANIERLVDHLDLDDEGH